MTTVRARRHRTRSAASAAGLTAAALLLGACGTSGEGTHSDGELTVVASTSVWGKVARAVGGHAVSVTSIISNNEADPHSYESTPRDAALISDADLVLYNGGGYDSFVPQILSSVPERKPVVEAVKVAGAGPDHEGHAHGSGKHAQSRDGHSDHAHTGHGHSHSGNEHVWYQPHTVSDVARRIADELSRLQPKQAAAFHRSAADLAHRIDGLEQQLAEIEAQHGGAKVITTAPVSDLLLEQAGLVDITPPEFVQAVEAGNAPSAATIATMQATVKSGKAAAMIYNPQTASPLTERIRARAERNHIPVVVMTETPVPGKSYVQWMGDQITALRTALGRP